MEKRKKAMSIEPPTKIVKVVDDFQSVFLYFNSNEIFFFRPIGQMINENVIEFFVRLCGDVMFEVLRYANRRRLTKLERVGLRFQLIVENFFGVVPFLRLDLLLLRLKFNIFELMRKLLEKNDTKYIFSEFLGGTNLSV